MNCVIVLIKNKGIFTSIYQWKYKNIEKEVIDKFGEIPKETKILTFDSFLYRYFIRPYELLIFENFKIERFETKGVDILHTPEPAYKNGGYNPKYKKKITLSIIL